MYLLHYIIPFVIYYFYRSKTMLLGVLLGNFIDLDHIYVRIIGEQPWFGTACEHFWQNCSIGLLPLHNWTLGFVFLAFSALIFHKDKKFKLAGWICFGAFLNIALDYIHMIIGFGI